MMSTSSGVALYTVATPENVVPKSTAITILSSAACCVAAEAERALSLFVILALFTPEGLGWCLVMLCLSNCGSRSSGRLAAQVWCSVQWLRTRAARMTSNILSSKTNGWYGASNGLVSQVGPRCQARSQIRDGRCAAILPRRLFRTV